LNAVYRNNVYSKNSCSILCKSKTIFTPPYRLCSPPSLLTNERGRFFSCRYNSRGMKPVPHLHPMPKLKISGAIHPLPTHSCGAGFFPLSANLAIYKARHFTAKTERGK
jgi:hypothetical protein